METKNFGISKPCGPWFDHHVGCGPDAMVSEALDNIDAALSDGGMRKTVSVAISSAQILTMKAVPVEIVPAMWGFVAQPIAAMIQYIPVSIDYALGDATSLYIGSDVNPISVTNVLSPISATVLDSQDDRVRDDLHFLRLARQKRSASTKLTGRVWYLRETRGSHRSPR
jgi:hypothetical protein